MFDNLTSGQQYLVTSEPLYEGDEFAPHDDISLVSLCEYFLSLWNSCLRMQNSENTVNEYLVDKFRVLL